MSQLLEQLRTSQAIDGKALESALRRQQIYGGSLDTVLLELDLIPAAELNKQLALANKCEGIPVALLEPGLERPWDALPKGLLDLGWAMPLRRHLGHIQVAIHPEIPADQRKSLEQSVEHLQVFVTCEACLAKLAAERRASVMPQRYAVLALKWTQALKRDQLDVVIVPEPSAPSAPWLTAATDTAPYTVASPISKPESTSGPVFKAPTSAPLPRAGADAKSASEPERTTTGRHPTLLYGLPVADDDEEEDLEADEAPIAAPAPAKLEVAEPEPAKPEPAEPEEDVPAPRVVATRGAEARPSASLQERLSGPLAVLESATDRDAATEALVRTAMVLSPRVALFGIKKEGLRGLSSPGQIPDVVDQLVEVDGKIEAAVEGRLTMDRVNDLDLRIAVGREMAAPCIFLPVRVHDRPVLMLYIDRDNEPFSSEEVEAVRALCELAGRTLEGVLRRLRGDSEEKPAAAPAAATPPIATPPIATPPIPTPARPAAAPMPTYARPPSGPSLFASPGSLLPPGAFTPPGGIKPSTDPAKPAADPRRMTPAPMAPAVVPPPIGATLTRASAPTAPRPVTPPPFAPPPLVATPAVTTPAVAKPVQAPAASAIPPVRVPPPEPAKPPVRTTPPGAVTTPTAAPAEANKPPIRVPRPEPAAEVPSPRPREPVAASVAATEPPPPTRPPSQPMAAAARGGGDTIRGRIQLDDEDRPRKPDPKLQEIDTAIAAALRGDGSAIVHLRDLGEPAMRRIAKQFPGELDVNRRDLDTLPPLPAHGALIRVALEIGAELGPYLVEFIDHPNPTVRFYIAFVFMELRHELAVAALGELAFDPDADVRAIAMRVLETYSGEPGFLDTVRIIRRELDSPNRTRALHATRAVGTLRDIEAVAKLIELLTSKERYIQEAALESLCSITGQQLGLKPHRWESWYGDNAQHHRVEWIMSSLAHKDLSVRRWAADELRRITGQRINFLAAGSKQEREIGLRKWVEWWNERGRAEFGGV